MLSLEEADALLASLDESPASLLPLALIQDASTASCGSSEPSEASEGALQPQKPKKRQSTTRERERRELLALRGQAKELTDALNALRTSILFPERLRRHQHVWRHVARRKLADRRRAEMENAKLKQQVAAHAAAAQAWSDRVASEWAEQAELVHALDEEDRAALDALADGLDPAYALVDVVFSERGSDAASRLIGKHMQKPKDKVWNAKFVQFSHEQQDGGMSSAVELRDERLLPFDFQLVMDAVWESWVMWHVGGTSSISSAWDTCHPYQDVERPEHTFAVKFRLACTTQDQSTVYINEKLAARRYMETADRLVMVWRGTSEGENDLFGHCTDETGWIVVERAPPAEGDKTTGSQAMMRSYVRMIPTGLGVCDPEEWNRLADLVIKSYEDDVRLIYREMETLLLRSKGT